MSAQEKAPRRVLINDAELTGPYVVLERGVRRPRTWWRLSAAIGAAENIADRMGLAVEVKEERYPGSGFVLTINPEGGVR